MDQTIVSHEIALTPASSMASQDCLQRLTLSSEFSGMLHDGYMSQTQEPLIDEPVLPVRKSRSFFRTCSSGTLHKLLNEVVLPTYSLDYMKILPPPTYIYMQTVKGDYIYKQVFMNKKGNRYIIDERYAKTYLQDIKGLYRYDSA